VNELSPDRVVSDYHQSFGGIKLLAELNDALQVVVEYLLAFDV